jgi:hypothetical protein
VGLKGFGGGWGGGAGSWQSDECAKLRTRGEIRAKTSLMTVMRLSYSSADTLDKEENTNKPMRTRVFGLGNVFIFFLSSCDRIDCSAHH